MQDTEVEYLRALFDHLEVAISILDDQSANIISNAAACELLGRTRDDLRGRTLADFVPEEDLELIATQWQTLLRDGSLSGMARIVLKDGEILSIHYDARANIAPGIHCVLFSPEEPPDPRGGDDMLLMCAWTKRVKSGAHWLPVEEFLMERLGVRISHGICPEAMKKL
ncbi:MAG: PAS domain-containing protein [Bryobacteraceae bacterium]|nr:PAS domain S-box protein [Solibacteraceae bacterium]MCO5349823.1 PAS domain-containing protein [Bryobacteraceae bacterium]